MLEGAGKWLAVQRTLHGTGGLHRDQFNGSRATIAVAERRRARALEDELPNSADRRHPCPPLGRLDEPFMRWPFLGSRRPRDEGHAIDCKRVQRLMRQMGIAALGPKPRMTNLAPGYKMYPYRLHGLRIDRPNQMGAADFAYPDRAGLSVTVADHGLGGSRCVELAPVEPRASTGCSRSDRVC